MYKQGDKEADKIVTYGTPTLNDWKVYLRNLQQNPSVENMATPDSSSSESSFELEESFKALLDRKRREMQEKRCEERMLSEDSDVASREVVEAGKTSIGNDSTFLEQDSISKTSDQSFEEMERICAVLDKVNGFDTSIKMAEDTVKPPTLTMQQAITLGDITQLDDVDEPSGLWENTILPTLSPVKRMHMLRPSTILEETSVSGPAEASKNSSIETYISTTQVAESTNMHSATSGSDVYRTAQDTFTTDSYARSSILDMDSGLTIDLTGADNRANNDQAEDESEYSKNSTREADSLEQDVQNVIILDSSTSDIEDGEQQGTEYNKEEYETLGNTFPLDSIASERDESLGEASLVYDKHEESAQNYLDEVSVLDEMPDRFNDTLEETDFMMKQGLKILALKKQQQQAQKHCIPTAQQETHQMAKLRTDSGSEDGSRPFLHTPLGKNVKKGTPLGTPHLSYLTPTSGMSSKLNISHGGHSVGAKQTLFSSVGKNSAAKNPIVGGAASVGSFKKPVSRLPQLKVTGRKFDHIVSPIGAYIKKTPQSTLQAKINCHHNNLIDVLHSENRDSALSAGSNHGCNENHGINLKGYTSSLPGKGVISSNRAHVLDERNVVRIPGGEKMQKLINNSPTMVIRHEGRIKFAEQTTGNEQRKLTHNMAAMTDDSLADLSVLSNDISVRVLKDAN
ncbi:uncharacterized protein LOC128304281 [Anopheles moucheti]|uniref:uncharacterized protein LOC128304281 n=1 Tax=Anopheles moucheti TaxID=186751 RepID=UPI0022F04F39|nr:uncharacterized protein LOC128304281 [Anopheles moucheti]